MQIFENRVDVALLPKLHTVLVEHDTKIGSAIFYDRSKAEGSLPIPNLQKPKLFLHFPPISYLKIFS